MRKWLCAASMVVVIGLLVVSYYITGIKAEKEFYAFLKVANNIPNLKVSADHYQRGWLKSTVHIHAVLHRPEQQYTQENTVKTLPAQDASFSFNTAIYHGPIIFTNHHVALGLGYARAKVPLPEQVLSQFQTLFASNSTKPVFVASLLLQYRGKLNINFDIPPFKLFIKGNSGQLDWAGLRSHWMLCPRLAQTKGEIIFKGATFRHGESGGEVGPAHLIYNLKNSKEGRMTGKAKLSFKKIQMQASPEKTFSVDGFQAISETHIKKGLIDSSLKADVDQILFHGVNYGPGTLSTKLNNLDAEALNKIQEQLQEASNSHLTDAQQQVAMLIILPELPKLLGKGAEFDMKQFQLSLPQGILEATAKINIPQSANLSQNPVELINATHAKIDAEVPVSWLQNLMTDFLEFKIQQRQLMLQQLKSDKKMSDNIAAKEEKALSVEDIKKLAQQQSMIELNNFVENHWLIKKDNLYSIGIIFQNGALMVNGRPFNGDMIQ